MVFAFLYFFFIFFFFNDTATTEIYTLSLHDALPIWRRARGWFRRRERRAVPAGAGGGRSAGPGQRPGRGGMAGVSRVAPARRTTPGTGGGRGARGAAGLGPVPGERAACGAAGRIRRADRRP